MIDSIQFAKLSGSGNDFICVDNRSGSYDELLSDPQRIGHFARSLCHRGVGVGADGIIFACRPDIEGVAHIAARFFEADGSEAELCGNGTGCFVHWVAGKGWVAESEIRILTTAGIVLGSDNQDGYSRVCIPSPENIDRDFEVRSGQWVWRCDSVVTGVPHVVTYVDDVGNVDVANWGPALRHHPRFKPRGANANFVQLLGEGKIALRTWEFGVEAETLACGTGSAGAAILASFHFNWPKAYGNEQTPVLVRARSGDILRVYFTVKDDGAVDDVCLETIVRFLCSGTVHPDLRQVALHPSSANGPSMEQG
jgi:diaminopimelate epimerase